MTDSKSNNKILIISEGETPPPERYDEVITVQKGERAYINLDKYKERYNFDVALKEGESFEIKGDTLWDWRVKEINIRGLKGYSNTVLFFQDIIGETETLSISGVNLFFTGSQGSINRYIGGRILLQENHVHSLGVFSWEVNSPEDMLKVEFKGNNFSDSSSFYISSYADLSIEVSMEDNFIFSEHRIDISVKHWGKGAKIVLENNKIYSLQSKVEIDFSTQSDGEITLNRNVIHSAEIGEFKLRGVGESHFSIIENRFKGLEIEGWFEDGGTPYATVELNLRDNFFKYEREIGIIFNGKLSGKALIGGNTFSQEKGVKYSGVSLAHQSTDKGAGGEEFEVRLVENVLQGERISFRDLQKSFLEGNILDTSSINMQSHSYNKGKDTPFTMRANLFQNNIYSLTGIEINAKHNRGITPPEVYFISNKINGSEEGILTIRSGELKSRGNKWG